MDDEARALRALTLATRTAVAMLGPGDDAREVAQEVATRVLEKRAQLKDSERFDAWVHTIAARETLRVRRRPAEQPWADRAIEAPDRDALAQLDARAALDRLGERERLAIVLHYVHDLPDSQIAKIMGCRRGTVHSLLSRARSRLREMPEPAPAGGRA
jgi:RNA polymerase sigma factor (sigma-70 family)